MRYLALTVCLIAVFAFGMPGKAPAVERLDATGEKSITEHGHHGGWGNRGGRGGGWGHGGGHYGPGPYYGG